MILMVVIAALKGKESNGSNAGMHEHEKSTLQPMQFVLWFKSLVALS
jgi:hypothetical protein